MKSPSALTHYFTKRINQLVALLSEASIEDTPELFHQVRVEIKKIRALHVMIHACDKKFKKGKVESAALQKIFKAAGRIRDVQVKLEMLRRFRLASPKEKWMQQLLDKEKKEKKHFAHRNTKHLRKKIERDARKVSKHLNELRPEKLKLFKKKMLDEFRLLIAAPFKADKLHDTRMKLKEFLYNLRLILPGRKVFLEKLDVLQEDIGSWHDLEQIEFFIRDFTEDESVRKSAKTRLAKVRSGISRKKKERLKKIERSRKELKIRLPH